MIDALKAFHQWLVAQSSITAVVPAAHIVGGDLPEGTSIVGSDVWMTFRTRGGFGHSEIKQLINPSFAITFWAARDCLQAARGAYLAFRDAAFDALNATVAEGVIVCTEEEVQGQDLTDPDTNWAMCVTYYSVTMRASS